MTGTVSASAPGKLVLCGEYAVLEGSPALSMAVDVRATALINESKATDSCLNISNSVRAYSFRYDSTGAVHWTGEDPGRFGTVLSSAMLVFGEAGCIGGENPVNIELDSGAFYTDSGSATVKLGLGSSAAVVVALCGALSRMWPGRKMADPQLMTFCLAAHHHFQGRTGSGVDIATSLHGGVQVFEPGKTQLQGKSENIPQGLYLLPVWTGVAADTPVFLQRVKQFKEASGERYSELVTEMHVIAQQAVADWRAANVEGICAALAKYAEALQRFDDTARVGIFSPQHISLRQIAANYPCAYKPSGAGGGDFGVFFCGSEETIEAIRADCQQAGFATPAFSFPGTGLQIEAA
ncbi:MAG: mevalonate kinase family protein [Gammaproteobacteria bacterium]